MIYKSNKLLQYVLILIYTHILNVSESTISFHRHNDGKHRLKYYKICIAFYDL